MYPKMGKTIHTYSLHISCLCYFLFFRVKIITYSITMSSQSSICPLLLSNISYLLIPGSCINICFSMHNKLRINQFMLSFIRCNLIHRCSASENAHLPKLTSVLTLHRTRVVSKDTSRVLTCTRVVSLNTSRVHRSDAFLPKTYNFPTLIRISKSFKLTLNCYFKGSWSYLKAYKHV